jgi:hypothetical protein
MKRTHCFLAIFFLVAPLFGATKPHVVSFGKWITVKWLTGHDEDHPLDLKVRPLMVDGRVKEYTIGQPHDITERLFAVRRAFRLNDGLPGEKDAPSRWLWQRGGWLLVDRVTTHISPVNLPEFDPYYSIASWYRDYVAYCGVSDDGDKVYTIVAQLGRRKLVLKKLQSKSSLADEPDSACTPPGWQRQPARVSFVSNGDQKSTYEVRGHAVDLIQEENDDDGGAEAGSE